MGKTIFSRLIEAVEEEYSELLEEAFRIEIRKNEMELEMIIITEFSRKNLKAICNKMVSMEVEKNGFFVCDIKEGKGYGLKVIFI